VLDDMLDKETTLDLAAQTTSAAVRSGWRAGGADPRAWLGWLLLRRSLAAERGTLDPVPPRQDQRSYLPRDLALSLLQARHEERVATGTAFAEGVSLERGFDYRWVIDFLVALARNFWRRVWFRLPRDAPRITPLASDARLVIVGDWGTGEGPALAVAAAMREEIAGAGEREVHVVHLGDVYYAGTAWEARTRFLDHWPVRADDPPRVHSWCLNGNHDMYSAGEGLFRVVLADPRFAGQRTATGEPGSEFHLRNDDWDVAGLDTSWRFHLRDVRGAVGYLQRRQQAWLADRLGDSPRRRLLLTHHHPFTRTAAGDAGVADAGNLLSATGTLRSGRGIDAWFWGHEHRLYAYGKRSGIGYATCMGHGAVLHEPAGEDVAGPGEAEFRTTFTDDRGEVWRMPGFTVVDLDGPRASVRYVDMTGQPWRAPDDLPPPPIPHG